MTKFLERREKSRKISKDIVVLYHSNCTDGFGGAWAAWKKFGDKAEYIGVIHQTPVPKGLKNKCIYSVDFTYPEPIVKKLIRKNIPTPCIIPARFCPGCISIRTSPCQKFCNTRRTEICGNLNSHDRARFWPILIFLILILKSGRNWPGNWKIQEKERNGLKTEN